MTKYKKRISGHERIRGLSLVILLMASVVLAKGADLGGYTSTWVGNTWGYFSGDQTADTHMMQDITNLYVGADGTSYATCGWDEGGANVLVFAPDGTRYSTPLQSGTGSWGRESNGVSTGDGTYLYYSMSQDSGSSSGGTNNVGGPRYPVNPAVWNTIRRYTIANGNPASWSGGAGYDGSMLITTDKAVGLAVLNNEIYSAEADGYIRVYNASTMSTTPNRSWAVTEPGTLAFDSAGGLWMLQGTSKKLVRYSTSGTLQPQQVSLSAYAPTGFGIDPTNNKIYVANDTSDQNILIFNNILGTPTLGGTFGVKGGIFSGTGTAIGAVGPLRFNHPTGVGVDRAGNIYVACAGFTGEGGAVLEKYSPGGVRQWVRYGLTFSSDAAADASSETDVFTPELHFKMDYSQPTGQQWTYQGFLTNRFKYPDDPRLNDVYASSWVVTISGHRFLYITTMYGEPPAIYRFKPSTDGECAIPCGLLSGSHITGFNNKIWPPNQPASGQWIWRDTNGNGRFDAGEFTQTATNAGNNADWLYGFGKFVDPAGGIWCCGWNSSQNVPEITEFPCQGLDANGSPIYTFASSVVSTAPTFFTSVERAEYVPATDTMYLSGYTTDHPNTYNNWGLVGTELARINNWKTTRTLAWRTVMQPYDPVNSVFEKALNIQGDYAFVGESRSSTIHVYKLSDGSEIGTMNASSTLGTLPWIDICNGISAYKRNNGEYLVFVECNGSSKILIYRWTPTGTPVITDHLTDADIGKPGVAGTSVLLGSTYTVTGGGADIWKNADQFHFAYAEQTGDETIITRCTSLTNTSAWAKAGVMFRDSTAPGAKFVDAVATESQGVSFQWRTSTGGLCGYVQIKSVPAPTAANPVWLKLVKNGTSFTAYYAKGLSSPATWTMIGSPRTVVFNNSPYLMGLAVTSHNNSALNTATFDNFDLSH